MLLKRLAIRRHESPEEPPSSEAVPVDMFASFLKSKVDKKRTDSEMRKYATYMDIDKDGWISAIDLDTCLKNMHN